ncbi:MAG: hypothetical protein K8F25_00400 [Fimbriimonadaceae bacterium]|nr:hypothetical protein [Alphaproteobacteria bacterium]
MIAKMVFIAGTLPVILLGLAHLVYSVLDINNPRRIVPRDRSLIALMRQAPLAITRETDMWRAWLGFNLSHGIGVTFFGGVYLYLALMSFEGLKSLVLLFYLAPILALAYVVLARKYWFRVSLLGAGLGCVLLTFGVMLS